MLAICRGMQELNVALGGSLHQRIQDVPGRMDHSTPDAGERAGCGRARRMRSRWYPGSWLHRVAGATTIAINSLHNQGVDRLAPGLVVEGSAPDGTVEAVRVVAAPGFAVGVQWHPEYDWMHGRRVSRAILAAFGEAVRARTLASAGGDRGRS